MGHIFTTLRRLGHLPKSGVPGMHQANLLGFVDKESMPQGGGVWVGAPAWVGGWVKSLGPCPFYDYGLGGSAV